MAGCSVTVKVLGCFLTCALLTLSAQGRTLSRLHKQQQQLQLQQLQQQQQHRHSARKNLTEESVGFHESTSRTKTRHQRLLDAEDAEDINLDEATRRLLKDQDDYLQRLLTSSRRSHAMKKRHDRGSGNALYVRMKDSHMQVFKNKAPAGRQGRQRPLDPVSGEYYEVEVKDAQNSSLCNYTVEAIPDKSADQSRTPKDLVNVKCNNLGSSCPHVDTHCCIQTYSTIDTSYANGTYESIKIYTGCVCSLVEFAELAPSATKKPTLYR